VLRRTGTDGLVLSEKIAQRAERMGQARDMQMLRRASFLTSRDRGSASLSLDASGAMLVRLGADALGAADRERLAVAYEGRRPRVADALGPFNVSYSASLAPDSIPENT
jgi:hypothetical protein